MYIINFISGPGVGKSLISSLVYANLKLKGYSTEYVQEYPKRLVWLKKWDKLNNQYHVSSKQYDILNTLYNVSNIDYIVMDGSLFLGLYYNKANKDNVSNIEKTHEMIMSKQNSMKHIYIYLERNPDVIYDINGRVQSETEACEVDKELLLMLKKYDIEYISIKSDPTNINKICEYIKKNT